MQHSVSCVFFSFFLKIYSTKDIEELDGSYDARLFFLKPGTLQRHTAPPSPLSQLIESLIALVRLLSGLRCLRGRFDQIEWEVTALTDYF